MIRLQGQSPGGGVSVMGVQFQCDAHGVLELPDGNDMAAAVLCESHGFTKIEAATALPASVKASEPIDLRQGSADPVDEKAPPQTAGDIDPQTAGRDQLKEWLGERKIEFAANTPTEKLRKMVVEAMIAG